MKKNKNRIKKVNADCLVMVVCHCPYCRAYEDVIDGYYIKEAIKNNYNSENCNVEVICKRCEKKFIIENIYLYNL